MRRFRVSKTSFGHVCNTGPEMWGRYDSAISDVTDRDAINCMALRLFMQDRKCQDSSWRMTLGRIKGFMYDRNNKAIPPRSITMVSR